MVERETNLPHRFFSADCEKKKRVPTDCTGRDPILSSVESILNYSISRCTSVDLMHLEVISAIHRWVWITRRCILRAIKSLSVFTSAHRNAAEGKMSPSSAIIQPCRLQAVVYALSTGNSRETYAALWLQIC